MIDQCGLFRRGVAGCGAFALLAAPVLAQVPPANPRSALESLLEPGGTTKISTAIRPDLMTDVRISQTGSTFELFEIATGHRVRGPSSRVTQLLSLDQLTWKGTVEVLLAQPRNGLPAGRYFVDATRLRGLYPLRVSNAQMEPAPETLASAPPRAQACPHPTVVPEGWTVWWPGCAASDGNGTTKIKLYAPQVGVSLIQSFKAGKSQGFSLHHRGAGPNNSDLMIDAAEMRTTGSGVAIVGEAQLVENGRTVYRGPFLGLQPDGDGSCALPTDEGLGEEPCTFAGGTRNDPLHALRQVRLAEAKRQAEEAAALADEQRQLALAQERAERDAAEAERRYAEANKPNTIAIIAGAFVGAMQDLTVQRQREAEANRRFQADLEANRQRLKARQDAMTAASEAARHRHEAQLAEQRARMAATQQARQQALNDQAAAAPRADRARVAQATAQVQQRTAEQTIRAAAIGPASGGAMRQPQMSAASKRERRSYPVVPEALSGCLARAEGRFVCWTSSSSMGNAVGPDQGPGWRTPEEWLNYIGQCANHSGAIHLNDGSVVWACGYGQSGNHRIDVAAKMGAQVQGRRTFYCDQSEVFCRRTSPEE